MTDRTLSTLVDGGTFFEGPRWHDGRWFVSDFYRHAVLAITPDGKEEQILTVDQQPSGLGWLPDGSMLVVSMRDHRLLRVAPNGSHGPVEVHADLSEFAEGNLNDMVVSAAGHAYVGMFGFDLGAGGTPKTTNVVRVGPDGTAAVAATDMMFPNGSVITPDGSTLIVGETLGCRYTAFDIAADGSLTNRRVWAELAPTPTFTTIAETMAAVTVAPDGCGMDEEEHIWAADAVGGRCIRVAPGGKIVDEVKAPEGQRFFACMLGGDDGRTLLMCAAPDFFEEARTQAREGVLLTTTVDVPRGGLP